MMLVDTNVWFRFYWRLPLPEPLRELLISGPLALSPVSVLEISTKIRKGHLPGLPPIESWLDAALDGYVLAQVTPRIAAAAGSDAWEHQDPADRLIVHTAKANGFTLAHTDTVIRRRKDILQEYFKFKLPLER